MPGAIWALKQRVVLLKIEVFLGGAQRVISFWAPIISHGPLRAYGVRPGSLKGQLTLLCECALCRI